MVLGWKASEAKLPCVRSWLNTSISESKLTIGDCAAAHSEPYCIHASRACAICSTCPANELWEAASKLPSSNVVGWILCKWLQYMTRYCKVSERPCCYDPPRASPTSHRFVPPSSTPIYIFWLERAIYDGQRYCEQDITQRSEAQGKKCKSEST